MKLSGVTLPGHGMKTCLEILGETLHTGFRKGEIESGKDLLCDILEDQYTRFVLNDRKNKGGVAHHVVGGAVVKQEEKIKLS